jgi:hypothetical protein
MTGGRNAGANVSEQLPTIPQRDHYSPAWYRLISWFFGGRAVSEAVETRVHFQASPDTVWNHIMFYEEVPGRPGWLLRVLLPCPLRTEGDKGRVGTTVRCAYRGGALLKRITTVEPPHFLKFDVVEQCLGIERCIVAHGGSYEIRASGQATDVVLLTKYQAYLRPRSLWRPLEAILVGQLHGHIVSGIHAAVDRGPVRRRTVEETGA